MQFKTLAQYFQKLESVSSRLAMTKILAQLFKKADEKEIDKIIYLSLGRLGPRYANTEFQMADKMVIKAVTLAYDINEVDTKKIYKKLGDLGEVASHLAKNSPSQASNHKQNLKFEFPNKKLKTLKLNVSKVYDQLLSIAQDSGPGSQDRKVQKLAKLLRSVDNLSARYITRIPVGKLRLGFSDMTIIDALSWMAAGDKSLHSQLENAYNVAADVGALARKVKRIVNSEKVKATVKKLKNQLSQPKAGPHLVEEVRSQLSAVHIHLGTPVIAALCQRLKTFDEIIEKMDEVVVEPKYDGTRLQIHFSRKNESAGNPKSEILNPKQNPNNKLEIINNEAMKQSSNAVIKTYTRNLEENSSMFPELSNLKKELPPHIQSIILDCEAIGYDPKTGKPLPFQMTITRKRKHGVEDQREKVALKFMVFDVLYVKNSGVRSQELQNKNRLNQKPKTKNLKLSNGDIHNFPLSDRRAILEYIFPSTAAQNFDDSNHRSLHLSPQTVTSDPQKCRQLHHQYLKQGLEGVVVKKWSSPYTPGRKGWHWVKMKEVESSRAGLADTLDCVVMGYYRGRGHRAKFGLGAFLVGIRASLSCQGGAGGGNQNTITKEQNNNNSTIRQFNNSILSISKIGTGLSDAQFIDLAQRLKKLETLKQPAEYAVHKNLQPDVWVKPSLVVEIAADNITRSPIHAAGLALRFPRLVKFRDDKSPEQASTFKELKHLYKLQK